MLFISSLHASPPVPGVKNLRNDLSESGLLAVQSRGCCGEQMENGLAAAAWLMKESLAFLQCLHLWKCTVKLLSGLLPAGV